MSRPAGRGHLARLVVAHVRDQVRRQHAGSALGPLWYLVPPAAQILLFTVVLGGMMAGRGGAVAGHGQFAIYLCLGLLPWTACAESLGRSTSCLREGAPLMKRSPLPLWLFPLSTCLTAFVQASLGLAILLLVSPLLGAAPAWTWLAVPLPLALLVVAVVGWSFLIAPVATLFRDLGQLVHTVLPFALWSAPIIYVAEILPGWMGSVVACHPFFAPIDLLHHLVLAGDLADPGLWARALLAAIIPLAVGFAILRRLGDEVRDEL